MRWRTLARCGHCGKKGAYASGFVVGYTTYTEVRCRYCKRHRTLDECSLEAAAAALKDAPALPTVDDVARYLKTSASSWTTADLQDELNGEQRAQQNNPSELADFEAAVATRLHARVQKLANSLY